MQVIIRNISQWLYDNKFIVAQWRSQRLNSFLLLVRPASNAQIIDLGGTPYMWELIEHNFDITIVNLPGSLKKEDKVEGYNYVEGDATNLRDIFPDKSFDIVFSNSVIEHVGDEKKQEAFASEVKRLANSYWIQTPSDNFPLEVHTGIPFYWKLPQRFRNNLIEGWARKMPVWTEMIKELRVISKAQMRHLFPDGLIYTERKFLLEKSYSFYKPSSEK